LDPEIICTRGEEHFRTTHSLWLSWIDAEPSLRTFLASRVNDGTG
jgi:hypothetical protein